jgi:putrescine---pyruvate transaminase
MLHSAPETGDDLLAQDQQHLIHSLHYAPQQDHAHLWVAGRGAVLIDDTGREFIDALAGLWNVIVGHGRKELANAAAQQMSRLAFASSYSGQTNRPSIELAERLAEMCYPSIRQFYFTSGGAEANESAFKTARYYWKLAGKPDKTKVISRIWGYHGTTMAAMSATGIASYWPMFEPRVPGFLHIPGPYPYRFERPASALPNDPRTPGQMAADLLEEAILREGADSVGAFIGEPVQGAGGVIVPPDDYWPRIRAICDRHKVLLIADEVITGFGRTGQPWALSRYGVEPDIVTFAKGITSGYFPMGGIGITGSIAAAIRSAPADKTWMHAFTYSGHPVGCAVALANLDLVQREGLMERAAEIGQLLRDRLQTLASHRYVGEVRGIGLMAAVELVEDKATKRAFAPQAAAGAKVHAATQERGMVTRLRGDVYNVAPCYSIEEAQVERIVQVLGDSIDAAL